MAFTMLYLSLGGTAFGQIESCLFSQISRTSASSESFSAALTNHCNKTITAFGLSLAWPDDKGSAQDSEFYSDSWISLGILELPLSAPHERVGGLKPGGTRTINLRPPVLDGSSRLAAPHIKRVTLVFEDASAIGDDALIEMTFRRRKVLHAEYQYWLSRLEQARRDEPGSSALQCATRVLADRSRQESIQDRNQATLARVTQDDLSSLAASVRKGVDKGLVPVATGDSFFMNYLSGQVAKGGQHIARKVENQ